MTQDVIYPENVPCALKKIKCLWMECPGDIS